MSGPPHWLLRTTHDRPQSWALLLLRVYFGGALLVAHAIPKVRGLTTGDDGFVQLVSDMGFPAPVFFAWAAMLAQLIGSSFLVLGLATRAAAVAVLTTLGIGLFGVHWGDSFSVLEPGFGYLTVAAAVLVAGGGRSSLDAWLIARRSGQSLHEGSVAA
jgi:putative oxidoreductase